jgi:hypothetical protein
MGSMSDSELARIVRMALLSIVRALEKKYPEIAPVWKENVMCAQDADRVRGRGRAAGSEQYSVFSDPTPLGTRNEMESLNTEY